MTMCIGPFGPEYRDGRREEHRLKDDRYNSKSSIVSCFACRPERETLIDKHTFWLKLHAKPTDCSGTCHPPVLFCWTDELLQNVVKEKEQVGEGGYDSPQSSAVLISCVVISSVSASPTWHCDVYMTVSSAVGISDLGCGRCGREVVRWYDLSAAAQIRDPSLKEIEISVD
ncbi:hypothetical protein E6O75_ATG07304 [Venturia nashicola]|uniref:Uncharacterized protein n=1 Tax=Venturia nashicola TaxID=86259 RepID=A0A4Z1NZ89_9PEZI|nr:hypothetical protein E6O75_ATG07304 [Venturia nashicola]